MRQRAFLPSQRGAWRPWHRRPVVPFWWRWKGRIQRTRSWIWVWISWNGTGWKFCLREDEGRGSELFRGMFVFLENCFRLPGSDSSGRGSLQCLGEGTVLGKFRRNRPKFRGAAYGRSARGHTNRVNGRDCVSWGRVRLPLFWFAG